MSLRQELSDRCSVIKNATFQEVTPRLLPILVWMDSQPEIKPLLEELRSDPALPGIIKETSIQCPPQAGTVEQVAAVGLNILDVCAEEKRDVAAVAMSYGIEGPGSGVDFSDCSDQAMLRYIIPFFDYIMSRLPSSHTSNGGQSSGVPFIPVAIQESLEAFRKDHFDGLKTCFIMMQFSGTGSHAVIEQTIKETLAKYGFTGMLARDKQYHDDLYPNIQTYMHGCGFGIAVFERIEQDDFNPNVSLEVGYTLGLKKGVLLLKEKTLKALQADLVGKLYHQFDIQNIAGTIPHQMERWMEDKGFI